MRLNGFFLMAIGLTAATGCAVNANSTEQGEALSDVDAGIVNEGTSAASAPFGEIRGTINEGWRHQHDAGANKGTDSGAGTGSGSGGTTSGSSSGGTTSGSSSGGTTSGSSSGGSAGNGFPAGWLYTSGAKIYVSDGTTGTQWMGRGVNMDDIFFCGYDNTLWMTNPGTTLQSVVAGLMSAWKPSFVRMSLSMDSFPTVASWTSNPSQYSQPMTAVVNAITANPGVHVLVTLRSDASMIGQDETDGDPEATGLPSSAATTPNATSFPSGTDATYVALVDSFANNGGVLFGLTNEPGGDKLSNAAIAAAMSHAVGVIRAEEDRLGVPHHVVSVQGNLWTSDISFYSTSPLPYDNLVYEVHGYPPAASSYTYSNIPVIIGEYGDLASSASFYADVEAKQIPNLAWDFDSYSDCAPDLVNTNQSATDLVASTWGTTVQSYLLSH